MIDFFSSTDETLPYLFLYTLLGCDFICQVFINKQWLTLCVETVKVKSLMNPSLFTSHSETLRTVFGLIVISAVCLATKCLLAKLAQSSSFIFMIIHLAN